MKDKIIICLLGLLFALPSLAQKKPEKKTIYLFGFATSFTDSLAYLTSIQKLDEGWIDEHKFLVDRSLYSLQLQINLEQIEGVKNPICTILFDTKQRRLQRKWAKIKKRHEAAQDLIYKELGEEHFKFHPEEYREVVIGDEQPTAQPPQSKGTKKKKKK
ncbi:MAG: hypothetical protein J6W75_07795 [Bacteroidaceae bacterium]|nr:hypothetical protein [Bacteroidaceae bacterium]